VQYIVLPSIATEGAVSGRAGGAVLQDASGMREASRTSLESPESIEIAEIAEIAESVCAL